MKHYVKMTLVLDPVLVDSAVDFLVGVVNAGVEIAAEPTDGLATLNVFAEKEDPTEELLQAMTAEVENHLRELAVIFDVDPPSLSWERLEEEDWGKNWKKHFAPFALTKQLVIAPTWEDYIASEGEKVVVMDPGMAFGTGHHATTALVTELLEESMLRGDGKREVLDVGTGTGILGMAAALFGAKRVDAIDNDPVAVGAARDNCLHNGLADVVQVSGTPLEQIEREYDLVLANIVHDTLVELASSMQRVTKIGGELILSGLLRGEQTASITSLYEAGAFQVKEKREREEWAALLLKRVR